MTTSSPSRLTTDLARSLGPASLAGMLDLLRGDLAEAVEHRDAESIAHAHDNLARVLTLLRQFENELEVALLDVMTRPVEVDGRVYDRAEKRKADTWARDRLVSTIVMEAGNPGEAVENLLAVLPKTLVFRKGTNAEEGVRGLGLNPDEFCERGEVTGSKLVVREVKP